MEGEIISVSERFRLKSRELLYPVENPNRHSEIEDMSGKKNREEIKKKYKDEIRDARIKYREAQYRINEEFKLALFKEYGVENHPKREKAFSMAWEAGHAEGYSNVEYHFSELVELLRD